MPDIGDVIQVAIAFTGPEGGVISNVFKMLLTSVAIDSWSIVADDVEEYLKDLYSDWFENVSNTISSDNFVLSKRDEVAGQWDEKISRDFPDIVGVDAGDSLPSLNSATLVAYPAVTRHWGFKNMPAPAESATIGGSLTLSAVADLALSGIVYTVGYVGSNTSWSNGVYTLAEEKFRGFQPSLLLTDVIGSRVTRKEGRGI